VVKAIWNGVCIAESNDTVIVDGKPYFPESAVDMSKLRPSTTRTVCSWKGTAHYHSVNAGGKENPDAAWFYPEPYSAASKVAGRIAFWRGVRIE
jgi:uncharacterized protein (DUF427 family)